MKRELAAFSQCPAIRNALGQDVEAGRPAEARYPRDGESRSRLIALGL